MINGVKIIEDGDVTHFVPVEQPEDSKRQEQPKGVWQKLLDWWNGLTVRPYAKVRDLADPFGDRVNNPDDIDAGSDGKKGYEIGIQISF